MGRRRGRRTRSPDDVDPHTSASSQSRDEDSFVGEEVPEKEIEPGPSGKRSPLKRLSDPQAEPQEDKEEDPTEPLEVPKRLRRALKAKEAELPSVYKPVEGYVPFQPYEVTMKPAPKDFRKAFVLLKLLYFGLSYLITGYQLTFAAVVYYDHPVGNKLLFKSTPHLKVPMFFIEVIIGVWVTHMTWKASRRVDGLASPFGLGLIITHCVTTIPASIQLPMTTLFGTVEAEKKLYVTLFMLAYSAIIAHFSAYFDSIIFASLESASKRRSVPAFVLFKIVQCVTVIFTLIGTHPLGFVGQTTALLVWGVAGAITYVAVFSRE